MSGVRQHFIPQFFQKGFSDLNKNKEAYTWQYRVDGKILPSNIKNVGTERLFYSLDDDHSIDDSITYLEKELSYISSVLRGMDEGDIENLDVSKLISHLEVRTRSLRQSFQNSSVYMFNSLSTQLFEKNKLVSYFMRKVVGNSKLFESMIDEELKKNNFSHEMKDYLKHILRNSVDKWVPEVAEQLANKFKPAFLDEITKNLPDALKKGHLKALSVSLHPELKTNRYRHLHYKLLRTEFELPLGDSLIVFEIDSERKFKPFCEKNDVLKNIYLPVSHNKVLCGSSFGCAPDLHDLDLRIAECSLEFFIASSKSERFREIQMAIGKNAFVISDEDLDDILDELIERG